MDEILKLAKECGFSLDPSVGDTFICGFEEPLEAFFKAAYNKGIEDAANHLNEYWYKTQTDCLEAIRALEKK